MSILRIIRSRIQLNRARAAEAGGDLATAFKIYREIVMDFYGTMRADILNKLGRLAYALRDLPAARTWYEQALAIEPDAYVIHMNLANTLHNLGLQDAARASYENALARSRGPDVLYNYALFVADEDPRAAFALIRESLDSVHSLDEVGLADELFLRLLVRVGQRAELFDDVSLYLDELEARSSIWLEPWSVANPSARSFCRARVGMTRPSHASVESSRPGRAKRTSASTWEWRSSASPGGRLPANSSHRLTIRLRTTGSL